MTELERLKKVSDLAEANYYQALLDLSEAEQLKYLQNVRKAKVPFILARLKYLQRRLEESK